MLCEQGFAICPDVVDEIELQFLGQKLLWLFERFQNLPNEFRKELGKNDGDVRELNHLGNLIPGLYESGPLLAIRSACAKLLRKDLRFTFANAILKPPRHGETVRAHQDCAYDNSILETDSYTVWLPFSDINTEQGTLYYLPGSHLDGQKPHRAKEGVLWLDIIAPDQIVPAHVPLGGIAVHSACTVHGSYPNLSDQPRLALSLRLRTVKV